MRFVMTAALTGLLALGLSGAALAQDGAKSDLELKYEAKVAESWFVDNGFTADYDEARERSAATGKPIFAYFTRSYAN